MAKLQASATCGGRPACSTIQGNVPFLTALSIETKILSIFFVFYVLSAAIISGQRPQRTHKLKHRHFLYSMCSMRSLRLSPPGFPSRPDSRYARLSSAPCSMNPIAKSPLPAAPAQAPAASTGQAATKDKAHDGSFEDLMPGAKNPSPGKNLQPSPGKDGNRLPAKSAPDKAVARRRNPVPKRPAKIRVTLRIQPKTPPAKTQCPAPKRRSKRPRSRPRSRPHPLLRLCQHPSRPKLPANLDSTLPATRRSRPSLPAKSPGRA